MDRLPEAGQSLGKSGHLHEITSYYATPNSLVSMEKNAYSPAITQGWLNSCVFNFIQLLPSAKGKARATAALCLCRCQLPVSLLLTAHRVWVAIHLLSLQEGEDPLKALHDTETLPSAKSCSLYR